MNNDKKTVGVITFGNYNNYGAILQSYALQKHIKQFGHKGEIIDYTCSYISNPFALVNLKEKGLFNYIYSVIGCICYLPRKRKCDQFRKNMTYSEPVDRNNVNKLSDRYDLYIAGSDQIWDYKLTNRDTSYFLDFVKSGKKCSYAASIGEHMPPSEIADSYKKLLSDFDEIIIREEYGADIVEKLMGKRPKTACDPTLLLTGDEWAELAIDPKESGKYILVYQLGINPEIVGFVKKLKKKTGLKVIYVPFPLIGLLECKMKIAIGPKEWIGLFKNAEYVVSDSFHGIVFALLFNKKFFAKYDGHHTNRRVEELLKKLNLLHRTMDIDEAKLLDEIDYTYPNEQLEIMRKESLTLLESMLV